MSSSLTTTREDWLNAVIGSCEADPPLLEEIHVDHRLLLKFVCETMEDVGGLYKARGPSGALSFLRLVHSPVESDWPDLPCDDTLPLVERERYFGSTAVLFRDFFAPLFRADHFDQANDPVEPWVWPNSARLMCYMWWDVAPTSQWVNAGGAIEDACFETLSSVLALPNVACRQSALHGLGHIERLRPGRVHDLIDAFLAQDPRDVGLVAYARAARAGVVQ